MEWDKIQLAIDCICFGPTLAAELNFVTPFQAQYWRKKYLDPNFHPNSHGGRRHGKYSPKVLPILQKALVAYLKDHIEADREEIRDLFSLLLQQEVIYSLFLFSHTIDFFELCFTDYKSNWLDLENSSCISNSEIHSPQHYTLPPLYHNNLLDSSWMAQICWWIACDG